MRAMLYKNADGTVVKRWADADANAVVIMKPITPPDEVEAKAKWDADRANRLARNKAKALARG